MNRIKVKEIVFVSIIITLIFAVIMAGTGSLFSGYHFLDDHWVIQTQLYLKENTVISLIKDYIVQDLFIRFRPLYQALLVIKTRTLGVNMNQWMAVSMVEGIFANIFLYCFCRNQGLNRMSAFTASGAMLYGTQFMPWYRALNQENTAAMLLAFVFMLLSAGFQRETDMDRKWWYRWSIMLLLFADSLMKESFCIAVPAVILYIFYLHVKKYGLVSLVSVLEKNMDYCIVLGAVFLSEIYTIVCRVGILPIGYAGIDTSMNISQYLQSMKNSFLNEMKIFAVFSAVSVIFFAVEAVRRIREGSRDFTG